MEVVLLGQRPSVFGVGLEVQVVILILILVNIRVLVVDDSLASHVVVVGALAIPVADGIIYFVVEIDMGDPVLDRLDHETKLVVEHVALRTIHTTCCQTQSW